MEQSPLLNLPVEVVHRIFDFFDAKTILCTVSCVCKRLHSIGNHYNRLKLKLVLRQYQTKRRNIPEHILFDCVVSLECSWFNSMAYLEPALICDILQCKRLRHLTFTSIKDTSIQSVFRWLYNIELVSLTISSSDTIKNATFKVVLSCFEKSQLQKLYWTNLFYKAEEMSWPDQCKLKFLSIDRCFYSEYSYLLHQLPCLETFQVKYIDMDEKSMDLPSLNFSLDSQITHLSITCCSLSTEHLRSLLLKTPKLCELDLIYSDDIFKSINDIYEWETFIRIQLNFLKNFRFFIRCKFSENDNPHPDTIIAPFRETFWLNEKRWFIICEQIFDSYESQRISLYTIPIIKPIYRSSWSSPYVKCWILSKDNTYYINHLASDELILDTVNVVSHTKDLMFE